MNDKKYIIDDLAELFAIADKILSRGDDLFPALMAFGVISEFDLHQEPDYMTSLRGQVIDLAYRIADLCFQDDETRFTLYDYLEAAVNNSKHISPADLLAMAPNDFVETILHLAAHKRQLYSEE